MEKIIRDKHGKIIGRVRELPNKIEARNPGGILLGWYDKSSNKTRYANGKVHSIGNAITMLF